MLTLAEVAELTSSELIGDPEYTIQGVGDLDSAGAHQLSFLTTGGLGGSARDYAASLKRSIAGALFISPDVDRPDGRHYLVTPSPSEAFQTILEHFHPPVVSGFEGVHPLAVIHSSAELASGVKVGPHAVIDRDVNIGPGTTIGPGAYIGPQVDIGSRCHLAAQVVVLEDCKLGDRVTLHPSCVIGSRGFGYATGADGKHTPLRHVGNVIIEDDVEIGACTTIDRARFGSTTIRRGTKIDNLVQIAHGVEVGEDNMIVSQTGIAGSTKLGRNVVLAGQVGVTGHATIADGVIVGARSGVMGSLTESGKYAGEIARPLRDARKWYGNIIRLEKLYKRVDELESTLKSLSEAD
jgi:UDP-3-O-[3-hydroxymyristoyl] glucosamine N-acyltransferase